MPTLGREVRQSGAAASTGLGLASSFEIGMGMGIGTGMTMQLLQAKSAIASAVVLVKWPIVNPESLGRGIKIFSKFDG